MAPDSVLSSTLEEIRKRNERVIAISDMGPAVVQRLAEEDTPRLLAAIEAVLKLAGSARCVDEDYDVENDRFVPVKWNLDPAKVRAAISQELNGDSTDGG